MKIFKSLWATRYLTLLTLVMALLTNGVAVAQNQPIVLSEQDVTAQKALTEIRAQTGLGVAYDGSRFDVNRVISFPTKSLTLDQAMHQIMAGTGFGYAITHNIITITDKPEQIEKVEQRVLEEKNGDRYSQSSPDDFSPAPLIREVKREETPVINSVEENKAAEPEVVMTSHHVPITKYLGNYDKLPSVALKMNLLYGAATLTPNLELEVGVAKRSTLAFSGSYNPWDRKGDFESNKKLVHMILRGQYRYWTCERYNGHFVGGGAIFSHYNIGGKKIPGIFKKSHRYRGYAVGGEFVYGHNFMLGKKWGLELGLAVGVMHFKYDKYDCAVCDRDPAKGSKTYFGPTNAMVSLVFLIK